jgi:hypothetical protein
MKKNIVIPVIAMTAVAAVVWINYQSRLVANRTAIKRVLDARLTARKVCENVVKNRIGIQIAPYDTALNQIDATTCP